MPAWLTRLRLKFQRLVRPSRDAELSEELRLHLELMEEENRAAGMAPEEARRAAQRQFGNRVALQEASRDLFSFAWLEALGQDVRHALRGYRRNPGFTSAVVVTLALGIGANAALFRLLDDIVLSPLPVRSPHELVALQGYHDDRGNAFSYPLLREMSARQTTVAGILASGLLRVEALAVGGRAVQEPVSAWVATGNYFELLGTTPQIGRFFAPADDDPARPATVVLADHFWRRELGGGPDVLERQMRVNGVLADVIGVARPEFTGERVGQPADFWMPISFIGDLGSPSSLTASSIWLQPMARLRPGVRIGRAEAELSLLWDHLREFSIQFAGVSEYHLEVLPAPRGLGTLHTQFSQSLWLLTGIAGVVALIACCNLANLLLARGTARQHEMAIRLAIGAGRWRVVRQLLTESAGLAALGGAGGLLLALAASRALVGLASAGEQWRLTLAIDWRLIAFTALVTCAATAVFGLVPALTASGVAPAAPLQEGGTTHTGSRSRRVVTGGLVVAQVGLSLVLVAGAALLIRSFWNLTHQEFGFEPRDVLMARVEANERSFRALVDQQTHLAIARRVSEIPGVVSAAVGPELFGWISSAPGVRLTTPERTVSESSGVRLLSVSPGYSETVGISPIRGRTIGDDDRRDGRRVAVVSETAARLIFGTDDALGRRFAPGDELVPDRELEVVGVLSDFRLDSARGPLPPVVFVALQQHPPSEISPNIVLRSSAPPLALQERLEEAVHEVVPTASVAGVKRLEDLVSTSIRRERLLAWLSGAFGVLAALLAAVGLYGVVAYAARLRTREIAIRLTLAASPRQVSLQVMRGTLGLLVAGILCGAVVTLAVSRSLDTLLYGLESHDVTTLAGVLILLTVMGLTAAYLPARQATRLDPIGVLRRS